MTVNPMQSAHDAPRCKAKSKRTGKPCGAPAVRGYRVCRMHGARGGAPTGKRNGNYRDGMRWSYRPSSVRAPQAPWLAVGLLGTYSERICVWRFRSLWK
jgi:hypothetical protein